MRGNPIEQRNQVEQEKHPFFARILQDLVHTGNGQLAEAADLVQFLVVDSDPNASRRLRDDHQRSNTETSSAGSGLP